MLQISCSLKSTPKKIKTNTEPNLTVVTKLMDVANVPDIMRRYVVNFFMVRDDFIYSLRVFILCMLCNLCAIHFWLMRRTSGWYFLEHQCHRNVVNWNRTVHYITINNFLRESRIEQAKADTWKKWQKIKQCDCVYTFFSYLICFEYFFSC